MRSLHAELRRAISRSSGAFVLLCLALAVFSMSNAGPQHEPPLWGLRQAAIIVATLLMGRAAVVSAADFSTGTIRAWLISTPRRPPVFLGKLAATVGVSAAVAIAIGAIAYAISGLFGTVPTLDAAATATAQLLLACVLLAVFGHAVGTLTRSIPVALTITLAWILPAEAVLSGRSPTLDTWLPGLLLRDITLGHPAAGTTPTGGALHAALPLVVLDAVALLVFCRRDVSE